MKTKKKLIFKNVMVGFLMCALVLATLGTYAWFTDKKSFSSSNLEFGTIKLKVDGSSISGDNINVSISRKSGEVTGKIMPGDTVSLNFNVSLETGSDDAYYLTYLKGDNLFEDSFYYYDGSSVQKSNITDKNVGTLKTGENHLININTTISTNFTQQGTKVKLNLEVYAIQQANLTSSEAFEELYSFKILSDSDVVNTNYIENKRKGKTAVFVGDSITAGSGATAGYRYWELLKNSLELENVTGMGVGGSCISATSDYGTQYEPLINRYESIPEANLIQIFMGTNDYGHSTPLGTINDSSDISFYGALNVIIPALQEKYPLSRIVFVTPLHRYGANNLNYDYETNSAGYSLKDYVDAIKNVCERYSIPVIDLFSISGLNPSISDIKTMYMPDGIHPNDLGHKLISNIMANYLKLYSTNESSWNNVELQIGNAFQIGATSLTNRLSSTVNVYLKQGQQISLKDDSTYKFALYVQENINIDSASSGILASGMSGWVTEKYTITEDGWYGFTIKKTDDSDFDSSLINTQTLNDYFVVQ